MLSNADIDEALARLESKYRHDQKERERQYLSDRETLEKARDITLRLSGTNGASIDTPASHAFQFRKPSSVAGGSPQIVSKSDSRSRKARDLVREITLQMPPEFTLRDVLDKAKASPDEQIRNLDEGSFSATFHWFKKHGLIAVVSERQGKTQGTIYRVAAKDLRRPPIVSKRNVKFPLMDMVLEAISALGAATFGKQDVFRKVVEIHPEHAERIKADVVSALLNRLSSPQFNKIRLVEKGQGGQGNVYEMISASN